MIPSRTIAPACPCFSTSSLAGLHSSVRSKQLIENRISFFLPNFESFYPAPIFHLSYVLWSHSSSVVWKGVLLSSLWVCCSLGSQWDLLERIFLLERPRRTKGGGNTSHSDCECAGRASAPALSFRLSSIFIWGPW